MFMRDDKKKAATMIVARLKGQPEDKISEMPEKDGAEMADADQYDVAIDELMDAFERKDKVALKDSLKSFITMCMDDDSGEEKSEY